MPTYIKALDGIRGLGILFVLGYHYIRLNDFDWTMLSFSWVWIQMFFVQSGFLITSILLESRQQSFTGYLGQFYWRRALRILPIYMAYVLAAAITFAIWREPDGFDRRLPYLLTFSYNLNWLTNDPEQISVWFVHFWSLAVEEQFYLVWPLGVFLLSLRQLRWALAVIVLLAPVFRYWFVGSLIASGYSQQVAGEISYSFAISQLDAFALGAAIPIFNLHERVKRPGQWALAMAVLVLAAGAINLWLLRGDGVHLHATSLGLVVNQTSNLQHVWSYTPVNVLFMFVVLYLIAPRYDGLFTNTMLVALGKIVYGMYVVHLGILLLISRFNRDFLNSHAVAFTMGFMLTFGVAYLSYRYFEKPILSFRDYWRPRKPPVTATSVAPVVD